MRNSSHGFASEPRKTIGIVQSAIGTITVARRDGFVVKAHAGSALHQDDVIETGPQSLARLVFYDGTTFNMRADTRLALRGFPHDPYSLASSLAVDRGAFTFRVGTLAKAGGLIVDTPFASVQGRPRSMGIGSLSLAVLAFSVLQDLQNAHALSTDDDTIAPKNSDHGTFEIITRSGAVILVDDPGLTYSVEQNGSVTRHANSSARMEELHYAQQAVLGTYARGFESAPGSSAPLEFQGVPDLQPLAVPIKFQALDSPPAQIEPVLLHPVEIAPPPILRPPPAIPPEIKTFTFDSGISGDHITNNNALVLFGTAEPGSAVTIFDGRAQLGFAIADASGTWSFKTDQLSDGEHAFTVSAGVGGATTTARSTFASLAVATENTADLASAPYIVIIDTKAPCAPTITALDGTVDGAHHNLTTDTTPTLTIAAEDGSTVQIYRDGAQVGTATETSTAGIFTFTSAHLSDGCYAFTATATDIAGNTSTASCKFDVGIDATAPLAPVITKLAHDCYCPESRLTDDATPTLTITAEAGTIVEIHRDGAFVGTATDTAKGGVFTFTSAELADGDHTFTATATDKAGNISPLSTAFAVTVVTSDPNDFDSLAMGPCVMTDSGGTVHGTSEADTIRFNDDGCEPGRTIYAGAGHDAVTGTDRDDTIYAGSGNDRIFGGRGNDMMFGGFGHDAIYGGKGNDVLVGGYGSDFLSGGKGHDTFVFLSVVDSPPCQPDLILDFDSRCDRIDLSTIDADVKQAGSQAFIFAGQTDTHTVVEHGITWYFDPHTNKTYLLADTDGDATTAELDVALSGHVHLTQDNVIL